MKHIIAYLFALTLMLSGCQPVSVFEPDNINKSYLLELHNKERQRERVPDLKEDNALNIYAQKHVEWMASHKSLTHSDFKGIRYRYIAENIARGQSDELSVIKAWMKSYGHRKNILDKNYTHIGIGYIKLKSGQPYWCVVFGG